MLNIVFTVVAVALLALTLRGARDPVCGMAVDGGTALSAVHGGRRYFFCAPGCRARFEAATAASAAAADPAAER